MKPRARKKAFIRLRRDRLQLALPMSSGYVNNLNYEGFERRPFNLKFWPVPDSYKKTLPLSGDPGSFWEGRGDRNHCGIDIYAPRKSAVLAVDTGRIAQVGMFTSPRDVPYWNVTYYLLICHDDGLVSKYAELEEVLVKEGDVACAGDVIGRVGSVLNPEKITANSPAYIQLLKENGHSSMLHLELYKGIPLPPHDYLGGNAFKPSRPLNLLDPKDFLDDLVR
jgi:murein DD-endopeptidase MepM/ murein hydrolase activator NlpD